MLADQQHADLCEEIYGAKSPEYRKAVAEANQSQMDWLQFAANKQLKV